MGLHQMYSGLVLEIDKLYQLRTLDEYSCAIGVVSACAMPSSLVFYAR